MIEISIIDLRGVLDPAALRELKPVQQVDASLIARQQNRYRNDEIGTSRVINGVAEQLPSYSAPAVNTTYVIGYLAGPSECLPALPVWGYGSIARYRGTQVEHKNGVTIRVV